MPAAKKKEEELPTFWFPDSSGEGYALGEILHHDPDSHNMSVRLDVGGAQKVQSSLRTCPLPSSRVGQLALQLQPVSGRSRGSTWPARRSRRCAPSTHRWRSRSTRRR